LDSLAPSDKTLLDLQPEIDFSRIIQQIQQVSLYFVVFISFKRRPEHSYASFPHDGMLSLKVHTNNREESKSFVQLPLLPPFQSIFKSHLHCCLMFTMLYPENVQLYTLLKIVSKHVNLMLLTHPV